VSCFARGLGDSGTMSASFTLYVPIPWDTSVDAILKAEGFQVSIKVRKEKNGLWRDYLCRRDQASISFSEVPPAEGEPYLPILGVSRPRHGAILFAAGKALIEHGALDNATYRQQNPDRD